MKAWVFNWSVVVVFLLLISLPNGNPVNAADPKVFNVNSFEDIADYAEGNSVCSTGSVLGGPCTLRAALQEADEQVKFESVVVNVPPGTYTLSIPKGATSNDNGSGDLDILALDTDYFQAITIIGTGSQPSIIDANGIDRVLHIGKFHEVTLQNLVITGGSLIATETDYMGGGIKIDDAAVVSIHDLLVKDNEIICPAANPWCSKGGGISTENAHLRLSHSQVVDNRAFSGTAIYSWDSNSTPKLTTSILNSTISDNASSARSVIESWAKLRLINTTMANNSIYNSDGMLTNNIEAMGPVWVQNSTLVYPDYGVNIYIPSNGSKQVEIRNSILISLTNSSGFSYGNCMDEESVMPITSQGGNVFTDTTCNPDTGLFDRVFKDGEVIIGPDDALLGVLQDNGGYVFTMKPYPGSPAFDRRPNPCIINVPEDPARPLTYDARDHPRNDGKCDAGAVEEVVYRGYLPAIFR